MNLKDLVPPLELCKQIPNRAFVESALVWTPNKYDDSVYHLIRRDEAWRGDTLPAPTLQEVMEALYSEAEGCCELVNSHLDSFGWEVFAMYECHDDSGYGGRISPCSQDGNNPAAAALKLWLKENNKNEKGN